MARRTGRENCRRCLKSQQPIATNGETYGLLILKLCQWAWHNCVGCVKWQFPEEVGTKKENRVDDKISPLYIVV